MLRNYLTIAYRNILRNKGYALINIGGLAIGLACCVLILLFVRDELSYDDHHERAERIYRVTRPTAEGSHWAAIGPPVGPRMKASIPKVEEMTRIFSIGDEITLGVEGETYQRYKVSNGVYADSTVFDVFTLPLIAGDPQSALDDPGSIVLSASVARRLFGDVNPIGRTVGFRGPADLVVTGIMADTPETTHLPISYMISMQTYYDQEGDWLEDATGWAGFYTYVLLRRADDRAVVAEKMPDFVDAIFASEYDVAASTRTGLQLQPISDIHLTSALEKEYQANGSMVTVWVFGIIALFVLVIAGVNFINLTTARSGNRVREVGVRKVLGSSPGQLARQFLMESVIMSVLALVLAVALIILALPLLNVLAGKSFLPPEDLTAPVLLGVVGLAVATGVLAGLYPATMLARYRPTQALQNNLFGKRRSSFRRGLVIFQFSLSIFMLAATGVVYAQLDYVRNAALGFEKEHVVEVRIDGYLGYQIRQNLERVKQEIGSHAAVRHVTLASNAPGRRFSLENVTVPGGEPDGHMVRIAWGVDYDYAQTLDLHIVAGRDFSRRAPADTAGWLINESAARALGLEDPVGRTITWGSRYSAPIVGVVRDFHIASLRAPIEPLVLPLRPAIGNTLLVRVGDDARGALAHVEAELEELVSGTVFDYNFLDDTFAQLYRQEKRLARVFGLFAGLAVLVACLGLFGLAAYVAERRTKEIGIRKVLGASIFNIVAHLSKEFLGLVIVAAVIAIPLVHIVMQRWLEHFAYRISMPWWVFAAAAAAALVLALGTVSYHALRAATANPIISLRSE